MALARLRSLEQEMKSEINADEYIDTDDSLFTFETCAITDDEILSKVTSIEEAKMKRIVKIPMK